MKTIMHRILLAIALGPAQIAFTAFTAGMTDQEIQGQLAQGQTPEQIAKNRSRRRPGTGDACRERRIRAAGFGSSDGGGRRIGCAQRGE